MTSPREQARQRAQHARDKLLDDIAAVVPTSTDRQLLCHSVEALWSAASLAMTVGDAPVYPCALPGKEER